VNELGIPTQPFSVGVTVITELIGVVPKFTAVIAGIFADPDAGIPVAVLSFVQENVAPAGVLLNNDAGML
jgi:hypothetical protein